MGKALRRFETFVFELREVKYTRDDHTRRLLLPAKPHVRDEYKIFQTVDILLGAGAAVECTSDQLFTPLLVAAFNGNLALAKRLVAAGANLEAKNKQRFTAACIAAQQGHAELLSFLLDRSDLPLDHLEKSRFEQLAYRAVRRERILRGLKILERSGI